jgi:glycosyltransferase involved in cell wall biosynthesis
MKVVFVTTIERGGPLSHLRTLVPAVARAGVAVQVVCATEAVAADFAEAGIETSVVPIRSKSDLRGARRLWPKLGDADIVHTHDRRAGLFARPQARLAGARALHTLHGVPEEIAVRLGRADAPALPGTSRVRSAWFRWGYPRVETLLASLGHVIVPSHALAAFLFDHGLARKRVHVVPHGIAPTARKRRDRTDSRLRLVTAANLEHWKGIDVLLGACARVGTQVRLDVFGDGALREDLTLRARELRLDAELHGFVADASDRFADADVFVLPSRGDNAPLAILEAMATGLPVIATRVGGIPELVSDGETGLLVEPDDEQELARAIDALARDGGLRARLGERGAARAETDFSVERAVNATIDVYEGLCASST